MQKIQYIILSDLRKGWTIARQATYYRTKILTTFKVIQSVESKGKELKGKEQDKVMKNLWYKLKFARDNQVYRLDNWDKIEHSFTKKFIKKCLEKKGKFHPIDITRTDERPPKRVKGTDDMKGRWIKPVNGCLVNVYHQAIDDGCLCWELC